MHSLWVSMLSHQQGYDLFSGFEHTGNQQLDAFTILKLGNYRELGHGAHSWAHSALQACTWDSGLVSLNQIDLFCRLAPVL